MRIATSIAAIGVGCLVLLLAPMAGRGQSNKTVVATAPIPAKVATNAPAELVVPKDLSEGASDIVKLFRAGKKDNVLIFYANNAGLNYRLSADDLIYLKRIGISEAVITAMMESDKERQKAAAVQPDFDPSIMASATVEPVTAKATAPVQRVAAAEVPTVIYPDYSAYPDYYQSFDNADHSQTHVAVSIGIGVGVGFGGGDFYHGYGGRAGHFGGRH